ncbi:nitric oxide synthase oxygenase [Kribbella sp. NPDC003557]|uniref:nitric oxide synthase oxygenase n=1 Tax=Kribbella sp. NPDC003557 TaxID=3154449 RepID=UPI0033ADC40E
MARPLAAVGLAVAAGVIGALGLGGDLPTAVAIALGVAILVLAVGICVAYAVDVRPRTQRPRAGESRAQAGDSRPQAGESRLAPRRRGRSRLPGGAPRLEGGAEPSGGDPRTGCPVSSGASSGPPVPEPAPDIADVEQVRAAATEFLELFYGENPSAGRLEPRLAAVMQEIDLTGTYWHTADELTFGARVAWRNNKRCIGRLYWRSLQVRDLRTVSDAGSVAAHCFEHLRSAHNGGKIRPTISVFAPETPNRPAPRIWNEQLIRYAGYEQPNGRSLGDPRYRAFTTKLIQRGWRPPDRPGAFDVLPLVVETADEGPRMFQLPGDAVQEVPLEHPELTWFAGLGLRWHAVPVISNNRLDIGGVSYPAAPFNGWYMGAEIGARNLGDTDRYDLVPEVADRMGLDTSHEATLWRDQALVEINRAVLHSFNLNGVTVTDHHTESRRFLIHLEKEERAGRDCPADWSWIVPPLSGSLTPVFHRYYTTKTQVPNFFTDPEATCRSLHGGPPAFP